MKSFSFLAGIIAAAHSATAQVDIEHRRDLIIQSSFAVYQSEQPPAVFGVFWFNENNCPWTNTALRVLFAGIYGDVELSKFLSFQPTTAIGAGVGGGAYLDSLTPYEKGERLSHQQFYGDSANARFFVNQMIPNSAEIPLNLRATYQVKGNSYRDGSGTQNYTLPDNYLTQVLRAEFRFGGVVPGLMAEKGGEVYLALEAAYRSGFDAFGPDGALFEEESNYQRVYGSVSYRLPLGKTLLMARATGGLGESLDVLSSYKLGGHLTGVDQLVYMIHGYYVREIFADDFGLVNLQVRVPLLPESKLTGHLYADHAVANQFDPRTGKVDEWHNFFGVGAGLSFFAPWQTRVLVNYGYGFNAIRNGDRGGHEVGLTLEKRF
jgi:hypothetical protein